MVGSAFAPTGIKEPEAIESYYLETREGLFFAVKGLEHPPDRWISVLRYVPDRDNGDREKRGEPYRRLYGFHEQEEWIEENCPQYRAYDPVFQTTLQSVPRALVRQIYDPRKILDALVRSTVRNRLEDDVAAFARLLAEEAGVPLSALGITGSVLIGMHTEYSDMDMAVFGESDCRKSYGALQRLLDDPSCEEPKRLDSRGIEELYAQRVADTEMELEEFVRLEERKANQGLFRSRSYFIRFIKNPDEDGAVYGRFRYSPLGRTSIQATIIEDSDAIFTPCRYGLAEVRTMEDTPIKDLNEIVSFRGRFCEQARKGDAVLAAGTLEQVQDRQGAVHYRLLLGASRKDTMIVKR